MNFLSFLYFFFLFAALSGVARVNVTRCGRLKYHPTPPHVE